MENSSNALSPSIDVSLPESSTRKVVQQNDNLEIWIDKDGGLYIDNEKVDFLQIKEAMLNATNENPDLSVILKGDRVVELGDVVRLMDLATESNVKTFSLGTKNPNLDNK